MRSAQVNVTHRLTAHTLGNVFIRLVHRVDTLILGLYAHYTTVVSEPTRFCRARSNARTRQVRICLRVIMDRRWHAGSTYETLPRSCRIDRTQNKNAHKMEEVQLVRDGDAFNACRDLSKTGLHTALLAGANINAVQATTMLIEVCTIQNGCTDAQEDTRIRMVDSLCTRGALVNQPDPLDGETALMAAAFDGLSMVIRHLLHLGANPRMLNCDGESALSLASNDASHSILCLAVSCPWSMRCCRARSNACTKRECGR